MRAYGSSVRGKVSEMQDSILFMDAMMASAGRGMKSFQ